MGIMKVHLTSSQMIGNSLDDTRYCIHLAGSQDCHVSTKKRTVTICW